MKWGPGWYLGGNKLLIYNTLVTLFNSSESNYLNFILFNWLLFTKISICPCIVFIKFYLLTFPTCFGPKRKYRKNYSYLNHNTDKGLLKLLRICDYFEKLNKLISARTVTKKKKRTSFFILYHLGSLWMRNRWVIKWICNTIKRAETNLVH